MFQYSQDMPHWSKLKINSYLYETGLNFVKSYWPRTGESYLTDIERTARWAWFHHPGRFADGALENLVLGLGLDLKANVDERTINVPRRKQYGNRTLHLATTLMSAGGHSRVLVKWVERDKSSEHVVLLTDQKQTLPDFLQQAVKKSGNQIICLPSGESRKRRAALVRRLAQSCDRVILHTHPNDTIPVLAFAKKEGPPVAMFNHAHFSFNLGSTVSDIIINTLEYFQNISRKYRFAKGTTILPISTSLWPFGSEVVDKEAAKRKLSLPENSTVLMSIAQEHYFQPMEGYNFFLTAEKILNDLPDAYLILVGINKDSPLFPVNLRSNPRFLLMGNVQNPIIYYQACDIFLESFPMPSLGGLTEAIAHGEAYPVPAYGSGENILSIQQSLVPLPYRPPNENEYIKYVVQLSKKKKTIRGEAYSMRRMIEENDRLLDEQLSSLNNLIDRLNHSPTEIPVSKMLESHDCIILAEKDQSDIGEKIDALFPYIPSIFHQLRAISKFHQPFEISIQRIIKRTKSIISRRI